MNLSKVKKNLRNPFRGGWGKAPSEIAGGNPFEEAARETNLKGTYETAELKLQSRTFAETWRAVVKAVVIIRGFYPPISVALALAVAYIIGNLFTAGLPPSLQYAAVAAIGFLVFAIAALVEKFKGIAAVDIFKQNANAKTSEEKAKAVEWLKLLLLTSCSIVISAVGGSYITYEISDNTAEITAAETAARDSLNAVYAENIATYSAAITSAKTTLEKYPTGWRGNVARKELASAQAAKIDMQKDQRAELETIATTAAATRESSSGENKYLAIYCALVVAVLELLYIIAYGVEYWYYKGCKAENSNFGFVDTSKFSLGINNALNGMSAVASQVAAAAATPSKRGNPIGFQNEARRASFNALQSSYGGLPENSFNGASNASFGGREKASYWQKYPELCSDLEAVAAGRFPDAANYARELSSRYGLSESTVYRVKVSLFG